MNVSIFLSSLILAFFVTANDAGYVDEIARTKFYPMAAAAYSDYPEKCVADTFSNSQFIATYRANCDMFKFDSCFAFLAVDHEDKYIIASFRGSSGNEVVQEINTTIFEQPVPGVAGGRVNPYFSNAYSLLESAGLKNGILTAKNQFPDYNVMVTGHSLGAALASICAGTLSKLGYFDKDRIQLITFGQPRVGNTDYAKAIDTLVPFSYRVVHNGDIVARIPPNFLYDYSHHASEVYYNNDMTRGSTYVTCDTDESSDCSSGILGFSWDDHGLYFDTDVGFARNGCKKM